MAREVHRLTATKTDQTGSVVKAKFRLVAEGSRHEESIDGLNTFAPTPCTCSIRLVVTVTLENGLDLNHIHAEQAFVQSKVDTDVYVRMQHRCGDIPGKTVLLKKSLYGLEQACAYVAQSSSADFSIEQL